MKLDEHLGTASELCYFAMEMATQLEKHRDEKQPLRDVETSKVIEMMIKNIRARLDEIECLDPSSCRDLITKQCTHIANETMMMFLRVKYNV